MKNFIKPAKVVTMTAPYARESGEGVLVGALFGIASGKVANGEEFEMAIHGQFAHAKATGAGTGGAQGGNAYWDNTAKLVTGVASGNKLIGAFAAVYADGATSCEVILLP